MRGTIKKLTRDRAFGFIRAEDGVDSSFHESELHGGIVFDDIHEGEAVVFEPAHGPKGPKAVDIHKAV